MRKYLRFPSLAILLAMALAIASAGAASAATKRLKPLDFVPMSNDMNVMRSPLSVGGAGAVFYAPLNLPAGAKITGFRFFSNGAARYRSASLFRWGDPSGLTIADASSIAEVPSQDTPEPTSGVVDPALSTVDANHLYGVILTTGWADIAIWAVDVDYTP